MQINRNDVFYSSDDGIAATEKRTVHSASAHRHNPFRCGRRIVGAQQRFTHVLSHRARDKQHVGMPRRGDETHAEALEIVERVVQRVDFQFAAIARAGVDLTNGERTPEPRASGAVHVRGEFGERGLVRPRRGLRQRCVRNAFEQSAAHDYRSCPEYEQLNDLLQIGKSAMMLPSIAVSSSGHWNQDASRRWHRATVPSALSRSQTSTSPRNASTSAKPSLAPCVVKTVRTSPGGSESSNCSSIDRLCSTSRMRIQTRALTSPASRTGTSKRSRS